jgi:hypothetical protein
VPRDGATNFRCQRCHDEAAPGRLTQVAHLGRHLASLDRRARVLDDGGRQARALLEDTTGVACVRCHQEHRGAAADLRRIDAERCLVCHADGAHVSRAVEGFGPGEHPDYWVMTPAGEPRAVATGMSQFSHGTHLEALADGRPPSEALCARCHAIATGPTPDGRGRDFAAIDFATHCAECHRKDLAVRWPAAARVEHRDPRVLTEVRRLRYRLWPELHLLALAGLRRDEERLNLRLERLADPLDKRDPSDLKALLQTFRRERMALDAALAQPRPAGDPLQRVREIAKSLPPAEGEEVDAELRMATPSVPVRAADFEARRAELLLLLDELEKAKPGDGRAQALRVRLMRLTPGELPLESLRRARAERVEAIGRLEDELRVRSEGSGYVQPPAGLQERLRQVRGAIQDLEHAATAPAAPDPSARAEMEDALAALTGTPTAARPQPAGCAYCHDIQRGTFSPMRPAVRVLDAAEFRHEKHLAERGCQACHGEMAGRASAAADEAPLAHFERARTEMVRVHLKPIASCQECHRSGARRRDCVQCHRYHVPAS